MVPAYRLPHGFSSSYHRHVYGMEPVVIGGVPEDQIPLNPAPGVFFPEKIELHQRPADAQPPDHAPAPVPRVMLQPPQSVKKTTPRR